MQIHDKFVCLGNSRGEIIMVANLQGKRFKANSTIWVMSQSPGLKPDMFFSEAGKTISL